MSIQEMLYYVYEAKVAAEFASGVGMETDIFMLRKGKELTRLPDKSIDVLEKLRLQMERRELTDKRQELIKAVIPSFNTVVDVSNG